MKKQLLLFAMILLPLVASAHDIEVQNADGVTIYYNYFNNGTELEVTFRGGSYQYQGNVAIPEEVTFMNRTRKVTSIGGSAFDNCYKLTSVTIPNSVTSIGNAAFSGCSGLKKVIVKDIAAWCGIKFGGLESNPLYYAKHLYSDEDTEITNLVIPNSVTSIGDTAFYGCSGLTSVTIGSGVTSIGREAFWNCSGLKKVIVKDIAAWCGIKFDGYGSNPLEFARHIYSNEDTEITNLVIPNSVTSIGGSAFVWCSSLTSVTIGSGVTSIGDGAFEGCPGLTSVTIPNSVTSIGRGAFSGCSGLTSITIGSGVTSVGNRAFDGVDIPTIISLIENPFTIKGKTSNFRTFSQNTFLNATLYVPKGTIDKYKATDGWKDFLFIEEGTGGGDTPTTQKCEKPTISYSNGKLTFVSSTEGATCQSTITDADIRSYSGNEIQLGVTYVINVYATKSGYDNSDVATATLCWIDASPKTEGITNGVAQIAARPVLVKTDNGFITVEGVDDRTNVTVYTTDGKQVGSAISQNNIATIATSIQPGSIAIVKVGDKAVKVVIK